jgi:membrane protease YdiL (CAAX protease family)
MELASAAEVSSLLFLERLFVIRSLWGVLSAFAVLFIIYQLPEGIGMHLLKSPSVQAALLLVFYPIAFLVARSLGFRGFDAYAMGLHRGRARNLGLALLIAWCAKAVAVIVGLRLGVYKYTAPSQSIAQLLSVWIVIAFTTFFPSVAEEIVTRGFWYRQAPWLGHGALSFSSLQPSMF